MRNVFRSPSNVLVSGMIIFLRMRNVQIVVVALAVALLVRTAWAVDIDGVREGSLDQPRMNFVIEPGAGGDPYSYEGLFGGTSINIFGFLDTGASGVVISDASATTLQMPRQAGVQFFDVGVGGSSLYDVSESVRIRAAASTSTAIDNLSTYQTVYNQVTGPTNIQIGPTNTSPDPLSDPLDVFGMPVMMGKTVVMDPRPVNDLSDLMHTFIYDQGTPFHPSTTNTDPGIPTTSHHVQLSYGDFTRFTELSPPGAQGPQFSHNPFIGPNPVLQLDNNPPVDNTPPVNVSFNGVEASGSFLLDTGAAASFISTSLAASLHVRYSENPPAGTTQLETFDPAHPELPGTPIANQFQLPIQGLGGTVDLAGFFLDDLLLHTTEGSLDPNDPNNLRYLHAPVLVNDITVVDPITDQTLTLDGVFGTNFLVASIGFDFGDARESPYNWITFDEPNGILGLDLAANVPEPSTCVLASLGLMLLSGLAWRKRHKAR